MNHRITVVFDYFGTLAEMLILYVYMRILIATGIFPPDIGGPATYSQFLMNEFPKLGHTVHVVTYGPAGISRKIPKGLRHIFYFFVCLFKSFQHDVIFAQDPVGAGLPALIAAWITQKKFTIRVAGDYAWEQAAQRFRVTDGIDEFQKKKYDFRTEFLRKIQRFVVGHAALVITPSVYFKNLVGGWLKDPSRVRAVYNGIVLDPNLTLSPNQYLEKEKLIISAGRLVPWKGFKALIGAMIELSDWRLEIIGDGPELKTLQSEITRLRLQERVKLTGSMPRAALQSRLDQARIFILNTSFESFSFQIVEAMYRGVPVITTAIGNLREIIDNDQEGILINPDDIPSLYLAIRKIDENKGFRDILIKNARKKAESFSIEKTLDNLENYLKIL